MILQSLYELYENRLKDDASYLVPRPGFSVQNITFRILLNPDGSLRDIQDARATVAEATKTGKTKSRQVPKQMLVPGESKPPGQGINPCSFWDNSAYLLGYKKPDKSAAKAEKDAVRALETFEATREHYIELSRQISNPVVDVICQFYENHWTPDRAAEWTEKLDDFAATGFGVFQVLPEKKDVHELEFIKDWAVSCAATHTPSEALGTCLVLGDELPIARLHDPAIKGVNGAAPGGAKLASFNLSAFESYGKDQSYNSPVSENVAFGYCNALNALLSGPQSSRHRVVIGDATTIFWSEKKSSAEAFFAGILTGEIGDSPIDDETETVSDQAVHKQVEGFLKVLRRGGGASIEDLDVDGDSKFYILGLSGNVTRLVVRFWHVSTTREMVDRLKDHYENLALTRSRDPHPYFEPEFPSAQRLLDQSARERKAISPLLGGQLMQAILHRNRYPMTLYQGVLNRLRANEPVDYLKATILKATLIRNFNQSIDMSLNPNRIDPAYLLGRLFAALEKTQEDALGKVNAGVRERFYSSASATPGTVFPRILRTYQHHLAKMEGGMKTNRERLVQEIHAPLDGYPSHLNLEEQGLFAIGYYHQRQDFFTKKEKSETQAVEA
ncbi:MAG: type I-C CRISPR-associated protein Cas8c/Csd1 [Verrucomicrobiales bacterium]|nr:type I-C CRISPR-associated protein Cas8c/Csd1 [Verrucomicrobiales bacterium]